MALNPQKRPSILGFRPTGDLGPFTYYTKANGTIVFFPRAPPKTPPTDRQIYQRDNFRLAAMSWKLLPQRTRAKWELATKILSLKLNGYNLWTWFYCSSDHTAIATIERLTGLDLRALDT